jgi:hypothetical protein
MSSNGSVLRWEVGLKALWGARMMPFGAAVSQPCQSAGYTSVLTRLQQLVAVRAHLTA